VLQVVFYLDVNFEKFGAHRFDLLLDGGTSIETPNNGSHVLGLSNGSQTSHTTTDDQDLGGGDFTGSGDLTGEEATKVVGGFNNRSVASNVSHGTKGIEDLSSGNTWNTVHGCRIFKKGLQGEHRMLQMQKKLPNAVICLAANFSMTSLFWAG
jgi:hypothetical protein